MRFGRRKAEGEKRKAESGRHRAGILLLLLTAFCLLPTVLLAQVKTTVADTLLGPDGAPVAGSFVVTCPRTFVSADGYSVLAQSKTSVTLAANGSFTVNLIPNAGASPGGSTYQVQYTANSRVVTEIWIVPISTSPVNLAAVRTASPPSPGVMLPFAQLNPPSGCAANQFPQWTGTSWTCVASNGGGGGTVSSVGLSLPLAVFSVSGSPVTSSGTLNASFASQNANQVLAAPNGTAGAPSFRALAAADLPASITSSTSGNAATATALASTPNQCSASQFATGITASGNANCGVPSGTLGGLTTNLLPVASSASSLTNSSLSSVPALAATTLGTITAAAGSGSLNATTTFYYTVVPLTASGIGPASAEGSVTTGAVGNTYTATIPYSGVTGATGYCLMGRASSGGEQLISCVHSGSTHSMTDSGANTPSGNFPVNASAVASASGSFVPVYEDGVVHASQLPGSDMCAQISNGWAYLLALGLSSGTVDARGITGTQNVAGSCFNNFPDNQTFNGTLLTQSTEIVSSVSQVLPNGLLWNGGSLRAEAPPQLATNVGTMVVQSNSFPASTPVVQYGVSQATPQLGIRLRNLGVSCIPPGGSFSGTSIGVQDLYAQENSGADYITVYGCEVGVDIENGGGGSPAINGGPWNNIKVAVSGSADSTAVCFRYGSTAAQTYPLYGVHNLICTGNNNNSGQLTAAGIQIDGSYINLDGVHIEQAAVGVEIAKNHSVYSATLNNVHCLNLGGVQGTSCVDISSGNPAYVNLLGVSVNSSTTTNVLKDNLTNGCTLPQSTAGSIEMYSRDAHNRITTSSSDCTASAAQTATALAATPTQCTGGQFATGVAASGNANCGTPAGSGNVSNSGTPTNGQLAQWTSSTVLQGISTVPAAAMPTPTTSTLGGVESLTCASHTWFSQISTGGVPGCSQPGFADISGTVAASQLPAPTASTLGGVESIVSTSHKWISYIDTSGVPHQSQPADTDISGTAAGAIPYVSSSLLAELSTTPYSVMVSGATNPAWATPTANGQCFMSGASNYATATPSFQTCPTGGGSATFQVNGTNTSSQTTINFINGTYLTATNPSVGQVKFDITSLPTPSASTLGGVDSKDCSSGGQFVQKINTDGTETCATPSGGGNVSNTGTPTNGQIAQWTSSTVVQGISTIPAAAMPTPTASTLGGIESIISASHNWIGYIDTSGVPHQSQPGFSDLSGSLACTQHPALTGDTTTTAGSCATTTAKINGGSVPTSAPFVGTNSSGQLVSATPVTSVAMTGDGTVFNSTVSGSPVTTTGTLAPALLTQTANTVLAGPSSGSNAAPTFRALAAADIGGANNPYCDVTDPTCFTFNEEFITGSGGTGTTGNSIPYGASAWEFRFSCGTSGGQLLGVAGLSGEFGAAQITDCTTAAVGDTFAAHLSAGTNGSTLQMGNIANWRAILRMTLDATTGQVVRAGFCTGGATASALCPGAAGSSVTIRYDAGGGDTGFYGEMCNGTACASTSSALCSVDTNAHTFLMYSTTAHMVYFSCDGGTAYSVSSDYPTGGIIPTFWQQVETTAAQHTLKMSFFRLKVWGLSR
jgi:hypothetical protein